MTTTRRLSLCLQSTGSVTCQGFSWFKMGRGGGVTRHIIANGVHLKLIPPYLTESAFFCCFSFTWIIKNKPKLKIKNTYLYFNHSTDDFPSERCQDLLGVPQNVFRFFYLAINLYVLVIFIVH